MGFAGCYLTVEQVQVRTLTVSPRLMRHRVVHFSDIHHRGSVAYLREVVDRINAIAPDFACFTGDMVEKAAFLDEALAEIRRIACPVYGCPGNHDYSSGASFKALSEAFEATGGRWMVYEQARVGRRGDIALSATNFVEAGPPPDRSAAFNLHIGHYPATVDRILGPPYDLLLAGHSHGGQVRIPGYGPLIVPAGVGRYNLGRYETPAGLLYVNPGIGTWKYPVRFNCRPEITVFEI
jgi:predicted MPP superfamily phosphohydrolase